MLFKHDNNRIIFHTYNKLAIVDDRFDFRDCAVISTHDLYEEYKL